MKLNRDQNPILACPHCHSQNLKAVIWEANPNGHGKVLYHCTDCQIDSTLLIDVSQGPDMARSGWDLFEPS